MKVNLKTHQWATSLTYCYAVLLLCSIILSFTELNVTGALLSLKYFLLQAIYILIFIYLTLFLVANQQSRAIVFAFSGYIFFTALGILTIFITDFDTLRTYAAIVGFISIIAIINLTVQVFRLKHSVISKYYRVLGIMLISSTLLRILFPAASAFLSEYLGKPLYIMSGLYANLYSLFVPVVIIILLKHTQILLDDYCEPVEPEEEYL
jgi:hypothetical protein